VIKVENLLPSTGTIARLVEEEGKKQTHSPLTTWDIGMTRYHSSETSKPFVGI
jgi:hypothetical protein